MVAARGTAAIRFCRHDPERGTLATVEWNDLLALYEGLTAETPPPSDEETDALATSDVPALRHAPALPRAPLMREQARRRLIEFLPVRVRAPLSQFLQHQKAAIRFAAAALTAALAAILAPSPTPEASQPAAAPTADQQAAPFPASADAMAPSERFGEDIRGLAKPGDVLMALGSPWFHLGFAELFGSLRAELDLKVGLLVYDLIPIIHPEWCDHYLVKCFKEWYFATLPHVDALFAISNATARDVQRWAEREGTALPGPVVAIPIGTGFPEESAKPVKKDLPDGLEAGGYILFVSTIEARKNHMLAFRIWRRLLATLPRDQVPTLVFAGRVGWLVADLMQQIINADYLDGKLMVLSDVDDATLSALYQGCRFTIFPSLYEGWGLPITESLGYGKACVASSRASVPEAGGDFCLYFDPDDLNDATAKIQAAIENPALIAGLEAKIAAEFKPIEWSATARALLEGLPATS